VNTQKARNDSEQIKSSTCIMCIYPGRTGKIISSVLCALNFKGRVFTKYVANTNNLKRLKQQTDEINFTHLYVILLIGFDTEYFIP